MWTCFYENLCKIVHSSLMTHWLWPSACHLYKWRSLQLEVTITWEVTSLLMTWPSARHFKWRHISKFLKIFFCFIFVFWAILHHLALKNFFVNFHKWRHFKWRHFSMTWPSASHFSSDRHLNDVTVTSSKWRADGQSQYLKFNQIFWLPDMKLFVRIQSRGAHYAFWFSTWGQKCVLSEL